MSLGLDEESRLAAAARLVGRPSREALDAALAGLGDRSWRVRKAAVEAVLAHPDRNAAVEGLVAALRDDANAGKRNSAVEALVRLGAAAVPTLLGRVSDPDPEIRKVVVDVLGEIADRRTVPALVGALADGEENVRTAAAEALGKIGDERAQASLIAALEGGDLWLQHAALGALSRVGRPVARPLLVKLAAHPQMRRPVYDLIGQVRDAGAADLVLAGIADRGRSTREAAVVATWALWEAHPALHQPLAGALRERGAGAPWRDAVAGILGSPAGGIRLAGGALLALAGDDRGVPALVEAVADERLRASALAALAAAGPAARRAIETMLADPDDGRRELAAALLGELGEQDDEGTAVLLRALDDRVPAVRAAAGLALGRTGRPRAGDSLARLLEDPEDEVKSAAARALAALAARTGAESLLARAEPLFAADDPARRRIAVALLGHLADVGPTAGAAAVAAAGRLAFALKDPDVGVRRAACLALGRLGRPEGIDPLLLALADEAWQVRLEAATALGRLEATGAVEALCLLALDEDPWVRAAAVEALGAIGAPAAFTTVAGALGASEPQVVLAAVDAAAALGGEAAVPHLLPLLQSPDAEVARASVRRLAPFGGAQVTAALLSLLNAPGWGVRAAAAEALGARRAEEARGPLQARLAVEEDDVARDAIRRALEAIG